MSRILIKNGKIVTLGAENKVLSDMDLVIEDEKIAGFCQRGERDTELWDQIIDADGKIVLPGFINSHMHFYSSFVKGLGKAEPSSNFVEILNNLWWRLDKKLGLEDVYYSALVACIDAIKHGTTTLIDHHASPLALRGSLFKIAEAVQRAGLRASLCYEVSDRDGEEIANEGIAENVEFGRYCQEQKSDSLYAHFGLHASFTLSNKTLEKCVSSAGELGMGFHVHTAEAMSDQEQTIKDTGMRVMERFHKFGLTGSKSIFAHCVHLNDSERELLLSSDSIAVHNPQSNMNNAVGVAPFLNMMQNGQLVGLGTDAMTTNMLEELRSCLWVHKLTSGNPQAAFMEAVTALTRNNALIANRFFPGGIGEIKVGNKADVILMDYESSTPFDASTFYGHLVFGMSQSIVDTVIANGRVLMRQKQLIGIDEKAVGAMARELSTKLWERF
jgi:putative selenium metabolism protein SsnA